MLIAIVIAIPTTAFAVAAYALRVVRERAYLSGHADGYQDGIRHGEIELVGDDTFTMLNGAPERWDDSVPPGGYVCAVCGTPVESEPCPVHGGRP